jgi:hypothetical protein
VNGLGLDRRVGSSISLVTVPSSQRSLESSCLYVIGQADCQLPSVLDWLLILQLCKTRFREHYGTELLGDSADIP